MRIISGQHRGATLKVPDGLSTRPTASAAREGLFNILSNTGYRVLYDSAVVLDVFAGSGSLGLEAASRGATQVIFIENDKAALECLTANRDKLAAGDKAATLSILKVDVLKNFVWDFPAASLVFMDPPWNLSGGQDLTHTALVNLLSLGAITDGALLCLEHDKRTALDLPSGIEPLSRRTWGRTAISFCRYKAPN